MTDTIDKSKPFSLAQRLHHNRRDERLTALRQWRRWANAIADGRHDELPNRSALRDTADALQITGDATAALEADANAVSQQRGWRAALDRCEQERLAIIAEAGGIPKLVAAVQAAETALAAAKERLATADESSGGTFWLRYSLATASGQHKRIFQDEASVLAALEARDVKEEVAA